jgi:hypothetical protein
MPLGQCYLIDYDSDASMQECHNSILSTFEFLPFKVKACNEGEGKMGRNKYGRSKGERYVRRYKKG